MKIHGKPGKYIGAAVLLEKKMGVKMAKMGCSHHWLEIFLEALFRLALVLRANFFCGTLITIQIYQRN